MNGGASYQFKWVIPLSSSRFPLEEETTKRAPGSPRGAQISRQDTSPTRCVAVGAGETVGTL